MDKESENVTLRRGSLPPDTEGEVRGYLIMTIDEVLWCRRSSGDILVEMMWWRDNKIASFKPESKKSYTNKPSEFTFFYDIVGSKLIFEYYLKSIQVLEFIVTDENKKTIGHVRLHNLRLIISENPYQSYFPILNSVGNRIGDLHICFRVSFFSNLGSTGEEYSNLLSRYMDSRHKTLSESSKTEKQHCSIKDDASSTVENQNSDQEHQEEIHPHDSTKSGEQCSAKSFDTANAPVAHTSGSISDVMITRILERGQKLRNAMIESVLDDGVDIVSLSTNTATCPDNITRKKNTPTPASPVKPGIKLVEFLLGRDLNDDDERIALETLRNMSPTTNLVKLAEKMYKGDTHHLVQRIDDSAPKPRTDAVHHGSGVGKLDKKLEEQLDEKEIVKRKKDNLSRRAKYLCITVQHLTLSTEGMQRVLVSSWRSVVGVPKRLSVSTPPCASYFVEYEIPYSLTTLSNNASTHARIRPWASKVRRFCSRRQIKSRIHFDEQEVHIMASSKPNFKEIMEYSCVNFRIYSRHLNQRVPAFLGESVLSLADLLESKTLSKIETLTILPKSEPDKPCVSLGLLKVKIQLGPSRNFFVCSLKPDQEQISDKSSQDDDSSSCRMPFPLGSTKNKEHLEQEKTKLQQRRPDDAGNTMEIPIPQFKPQPDKTVLLYGLLNVTEGHNLKCTCTYLVCRAFWKEDTMTSEVSWNMDRPKYNFYELMPVLLTTDLLKRCHNNFMVIEVWGDGNLVGISKLPLNQFYVSFRDPVIVEQLLQAKYPVMAVDGWVNVINLSTCQPVGQLCVVLALGTESQVHLLKTSRGLKADSVISKAPPPSSPCRTPQATPSTSIVLQPVELPYSGTGPRYVENLKHQDSKNNESELLQSEKQTVLHMQDNIKRSGVSNDLTDSVPCNKTEPAFGFHAPNFIQKMQDNSSKPRDLDIAARAQSYLDMINRSDVRVNRDEQNRIVGNFHEEVEDQYRHVDDRNVYRSLRTSIQQMPCTTSDIGATSLNLVNQPSREVADSSSCHKPTANQPLRLYSPHHYTSYRVKRDKDLSAHEDTSRGQVQPRLHRNSEVEMRHTVAPKSNYDQNFLSLVEEINLGTRCSKPSNNFQVDLDSEKPVEVCDANGSKLEISCHAQANDDEYAEIFSNEEDAQEKKPQEMPTNMKRSTESEKSDFITTSPHFHTRRMKETTNAETQTELLKENSFHARIEVLNAMHLPLLDNGMQPSCYVTLQPDMETGSVPITTPVAASNCNPSWYWGCEAWLSSQLLQNESKRLIVKVWHKVNETSQHPDTVQDHVVGFAALDLSVLVYGMPWIAGWYNITDFTGCCKGQIRINVTPLENIARFGYQRILPNQPSRKGASSSVPDRMQHTTKHPEDVLQATQSVPNKTDGWTSSDVHLVRDDCQDSIVPELANLGDDLTEMSSSFLSCALKQKLSELDEITQRLKRRLDSVTSEDNVAHVYNPWLEEEARGDPLSFHNVDNVKKDNNIDCTESRVKQTELNLETENRQQLDTYASSSQEGVSHKHVHFSSERLLDNPNPSQREKDSMPNKEESTEDFDILTDHLMQMAVREIDLENVFNPLLFQHLVSSYGDSHLQPQRTVQELRSHQSHLPPINSQSSLSENRLPLRPNQDEVINLDESVSLWRDDSSLPIKLNKNEPEQLYKSMCNVRDNDRSDRNQEQYSDSSTGLSAGAESCSEITTRKRGYQSGPGTATSATGTIKLVRELNRQGKRTLNEIDDQNENRDRMPHTVNVVYIQECLRPTCEEATCVNDQNRNCSQLQSVPSGISTRNDDFENREGLVRRRDQQAVFGDKGERRGKQDSCDNSGMELLPSVSASRPSTGDVSRKTPDGGNPIEESPKPYQKVTHLRAVTEPSASLFLDKTEIQRISKIFNRYPENYGAGTSDSKH